MMKSAVLMLALGTLGTVLSVTLLLMLPTDGTPLGLNQLLGKELPVLVFTIGVGFGFGVLIVALWPILQWLFEARVPRV
jgi:hypothetical protein